MGYDFYRRSSTLGAGTRLRYLPWRGVVRGISTNMEGSSGWVLIRDKPSSLIWVEAGTNSQLSKYDIHLGLSPDSQNIVCNSNKNLVPVERDLNEQWLIYMV